MTPNLKEAFVKTIYTLTGLIYTSAPLQDCSLSSGSLTGQRSWLCKMMYQMISHTRVVKPPENFLNNKRYLPIALTLIPYLYVSLAFHRIVLLSEQIRAWKVMRGRQRRNDNVKVRQELSPLVKCRLRHWKLWQWKWMPREVDDDLAASKLRYGNGATVKESDLDAVFLITRCFLMGDKVHLGSCDDEARGKCFVV